MRPRLLLPTVLLLPLLLQAAEVSPADQSKAADQTLQASVGPRRSLRRQEAGNLTVARGWAATAELLISEQLQEEAV